MTDGGGITAVFGGGGAKAAAHAGAWRALEEDGLRPDRYIGTSMGSVFAAMFAAGLDARQVLERVASVDDREIVATNPWAILRGLWARSLLKPEPFRRALARLLPVQRFDQLACPLTVTTCALDSGELLLLGDGGLDVPLVEALYASCALPLFLPAGLIHGRRCADGGLRAVLPLEVALLWPCRMVVAVHVGPGFDEAPGTSGPGLPPVVELHNEATGILMAGQTAQALAHWRQSPSRPPLVYVRPRVEKGATFRTDQVRKYVEWGYLATRTALAGLNSGEG